MSTHARHPIEILRFNTCGSVDDGKSTLIGRLARNRRALVAGRASEECRRLARCSLSPRERAGVRGNETSSSTSRLVADRDCCHRSAIIRQRARRPCLQRLPDRFTNSASLASQARIPETQDFNATRFEPRIALCICLLFIGPPVPQTVEFDVEKSYDTEKIQDVGAERMLSTKLIR